MLYSGFSLVYFIHSINSMYMSFPVSHFIPPCLSPSVVIYLFSMCLYFCFVNKIICTSFFRFHIYTLIEDTCFSLSYLLHSIWQSVGPSSFLQITRFLSFLCLSSNMLYILPLLYPFLCWWMCRLFPCPGYSKQGYSEHRGVCVLLNYPRFLLKSNIELQAPIKTNKRTS